MAAILYHVEDLHLLLLADFYRRFRTAPLLFHARFVQRAKQDGVSPNLFILTLISEEGQGNKKAARVGGWKRLRCGD